MTVEVWWARIDQVRDEFAADLDLAERQRLSAYLHADDRARFLLGCTVTRRVLATRFSVLPANIRLDRTCPDCAGPHGKVRTDGVELSVTHSGDLVGVAIARHPVGLDVEKVDPRIDADGLARVTLASVESADLQRYDDRATAFITYWTRKEAVVKATGDGIRAGLSTVVVSPPDSPPEVLKWDGYDGPVQLVDLDVDAGHVGALAVLSAEPPVVRVRDAGQVLI